MIPGKNLPPEVRAAIRSACDSNLEALRSYRYSWWAHWSQLADVYLPRRYKWFITQNQFNRGSQNNAQIVDETGVLSARTLASGMMAGLTSPTRPWFRLSLHGLDEIEFGPAKNWLAECERRMMRVFGESNFYQALGTLYHDNGVFASSSMIVYEDPDEIIRCYNPCLGEFFFQAGPRLDIDGLYREYTLTVAQAAGQFGLENVSEATRNTLKGGRGQQQREIILGHCIEPNTPLYANGNQISYPVPPKFSYRETYWEKNSSDNHIICCSGFNEKPFVAARWDVVSNDAYGTQSPGMIGLPATRQLQIEQRRKAEAIDKLVRPPMVASVNMRNEPMSITPGSVSYVADINSSGFKPAYQIEPRINEMMEDILEVQNRVKSIFFVDLFMMISELNTVRTATEIDARREEKLIQLGPVIERFENEVLDPLITRIFAILSRRGLLPEPPPEIAGQPIQIQYISMLAEAQRAAATTAIERLAAFAGNLVPVFPGIVDNIDEDEAIDEYANLLNVPPKIIRSLKDVMAIRETKAQQQAKQQLLEAAPGLAQAGKNLSETDVGGGQSALQLMAGG